jgi:hypothetical protein
MTAWRALRFPIFLSGLFLCGYAHHFPSPVWDAATLAWVPGFKLAFPPSHLLFTPFCSLADFLTTLSLHSLETFVLWVFVLFFVFFKLKRALIACLCFIAFLAWGALVPRPMGRLAAQDPEILLIDFHSHTRYSHDGRPSFTPEANRRWHEAQGYEAAFITDHNRIEGSAEAEQASERDWKTTGFRSLEGEEVSLKKTHLVLLGNTERVDNRPYDSDPKKIALFVADMHKRHLPVIASLPEYWLYHWGGGVQDFIRWGMDGFEIINSAPLALDFPLSKRREIVAECRRLRLVMTGISDNHGYGYATAAWNAMRLPGWSLLPPPVLQNLIIRKLTDRSIDRSALVQVLERPRFFPESAGRLILSPVPNAWLYLQSLTREQVGVWLAWIWIACGAQAAYRRLRG